MSSKYWLTTRLTKTFNQALATAAKQATTSQDDVITLFIREYHKLAPGAPLSQLFATQQLKDKVTQKSTDAEVEKYCAKR